jgi:hypothetical protein
MMLHPHPRRGRWLLALAAGGAWLLAGQHLAGQARRHQAGRPQATTLAPPTSTPVQQRPLPPARPASGIAPTDLNTILNGNLTTIATAILNRTLTVLCH